MRTLIATVLFAAIWLTSPMATVAAGENLTPDEQEVIDLFRPMARLAEPTGMTIRVQVDTRSASGPSPAYLAYKSGVCSLILALRDNANYQAVFATRGNYSRKAKLHAMLGHELGHCFTRYLEERQANASGQSLPPLTREEQRDDEVRADLFALAWAAVNNPQEFDEVYSYLWELRFELSEDKAHAFASQAELARGLYFKPASGYASAALLLDVATTPATFRPGVAPEVWPSLGKQETSIRIVQQ
jgi:hypothetical protein